ncbi:MULTISPECIES: hypothetical protein [Bacillaceae]|uniref:hypothetical protein n=1 Tax=Bacillaceae TaxID=186817 RepID=UPI001C566B6C|nr:MULTISPECIES: hypothetical protein [Rossellomorea]MBW3114166.1 hypothetical protein [Bacillus sp. MCCB 382]MDX8345725.1 hypothetical protein [Rossellomorea sp. YZS02]
MGYIAPIPHYQYKQYQERDMKVDKHPFSFFPIQPIKPLKNKSQTNPEATETRYGDHHSNQHENSYQPTFKAPIPSSLLAKLTGKGNHINEYV